MPAPTSPASQAGVALLLDLQRRIEALELLSRLAPQGVVPSTTEAKKSEWARQGQVVLVTDGGSGKHFQGYTGSTWVELG